jgi:hypothetical protein
VFLRSFVSFGRCLIEVDSVFEDGHLDEFDLSVWADQIPFPTIRDTHTGENQGQIHVRGERFASVYGFSVRLGPNPVPETFKIPAGQAGLVGDAFRPFASLPGLKVGQSWRMQVVNPIAALSGFGDRFTTLLVRVTGRETVNTPDNRKVDCLVVEAPNVKAWVDDDGLVLVQQVELPVGGTITARAEPYNEQAKIDAKASFTPGRSSRGHHWGRSL